TPAEDPVEGASITVVDQAGREVSLDKPAESVVAMHPADCEILYAIGAGETLVGRGTYCDYPAEVLDITVVESGSETNIEQLISLQPDVLLMSTMDQTEEQVKQLESAGITVVVTDDGCESIAKVYEVIELVGAVTGKDTEAKALCESMQDEFAAISASVDGSLQGKTVYFEVSPLQWGLWTAGTGTFMHELCGIVGLENAFADVEGWGEISEEQVIERDPDFIITTAMYYGDGLKPDEEILSRAAWAGMQAVANGNVYAADSNAAARPGPRLVDAAKELYSFIYGE
ncbi:MAG: ABC transporter substrate-binding protein, partial [Clostridia bacterium]|nr:ABC transporter substrate-binding protein [Clostridia bacterium]